MAASVKQQAIEALSELPDEASLEDLMERLYFMIKVGRGMKQVEEGRVITHEEAKRRLGR